MKKLGVTLTNYVQDPYVENYKTPMKKNQVSKEMESYSVFMHWKTIL